MSRGLNRRDTMNATFTKTRDAQPMGQYKPTAVDAAKATAEFRIVDVSCRLKRIVWHNGRQQDVTARELTKLQAAHTWAPDF